MKRILSLLFALVMLFTLLIATSAENAARRDPVVSPETPDTPPEIEEIIEEFQTVYRLTIDYIYLDGTPAAPSYTEQMDAGDAYDVPSPEIPGYIPTVEVVSGVMPPRDLEYTVIYIPGGNPDEPGTPSYWTIEDYDTPLGLGATIVNVGICIE